MNAAASAICIGYTHFLKTTDVVSAPKSTFTKYRSVVRMYRISLCEDNAKDRAWICTALEQIFAEQGEPYLLDEYVSGKVFCFSSKPYSYDIAIFDVEMEGMDGIEAAKRLREKDSSVKIIFTTAHKEAVFSSFYAEPLQYLLKPLKFSTFRDTILKAINRIQQNIGQMYSFSFDNTTYFVPLSEIMYFESNARTIEIVTVKKRYLFYGKLRDLETQPELAGFIRCYQSYLVNPEYIRNLASTVVLRNGTELPISRGKAKTVKEQFMRYLSEKKL